MNPYNDELQKKILYACSLIYFMCGEWMSCKDCPASVHKDTSLHIEKDTPDNQIMCAFGFDKTGYGEGRLDDVRIKPWTLQHRKEDINNE